VRADSVGQFLVQQGIDQIGYEFFVRQILTFSYRLPD
jgi:hypothetical protein